MIEVCDHYMVIAWPPNANSIFVVPMKNFSVDIEVQCFIVGILNESKRKHMHHRDSYIIYASADGHIVFQSSHFDIRNEDASKG